MNTKQDLQQYRDGSIIGVEAHSPREVLTHAALPTSIILAPWRFAYMHQARIKIYEHGIHKGGLVRRIKTSCHGNLYHLCFGQSYITVKDWNTWSEYSDVSALLE
jgi:hypothetical protein